MLWGVASCLFEICFHMGKQGGGLEILQWEWPNLFLCASWAGPGSWGRCRKCTNQSSEIHSVRSQDPTFETASLRPPGAFCILVGSWIALQAVRFELAQFCRTPTVWWRLFWVHLTFMFFKSRRCPWPCKLGPIWPCRLGPTAPIWNSESGSVFGIFQ